MGHAAHLDEEKKIDKNFEFKRNKAGLNTLVCKGCGPYSWGLVCGLF